MSAMTTAQLARAGKIAAEKPDAEWFCSYFAEDGDLLLYVQNLTTQELWSIAPDGRWAYLGSTDEQPVGGGP